jgi:hypothetical protein
METNPAYIELHNCCQNHHANDLSKGFTSEQIVAVQLAARIAPGVTTAQLSRNLLAHKCLSKTTVDNKFWS